MSSQSDLIQNILTLGAGFVIGSVLVSATNWFKKEVQQDEDPAPSADKDLKADVKLQSTAHMKSIKMNKHRSSVSEVETPIVRVPKAVKRDSVI